MVGLACRGGTIGRVPRFVRIPTGQGVSLAADEWPGPRGPVVLAHGGGQTRHSWGATGQALADIGHRVLSVDLRGHGDSDWAPGGDYAFESFAADFPALFEYVGEPVIWVGASLGGITGLLAAATHLRAIDALILVDITPRPAAAGVARIMAFMAETSATGFADLEEAADAVAAYQPDRRRPSNVQGLRKNLRLHDDGRWRWHWDPAFMRVRDGGGDRHVRLVEAAAVVVCPVLLVRGRHSDLVTNAEVSDFIEMVPHAVYVDVADAAHMVAGDVNDVFTETVIDFISGLPDDR